MTLIAPQYETVNPSMMLPEIIMPYSQASGAFALLPEEQPRVMLGEGDLAVYIRRLDVRTKTMAAQAEQWYSEMIQRHRLYVAENGDDLPEIKEWRWPAKLT